MEAQTGVTSFLLYAPTENPSLILPFSSIRPLPSALCPLPRPRPLPRRPEHLPSSATFPFPFPFPFRSKQTNKTKQNKTNNSHPNRTPFSLCAFALRFFAGSLFAPLRLCAPHNPRDATQNQTKPPKKPSYFESRRLRDSDSRFAQVGKERGVLWCCCGGVARKLRMGEREATWGKKIKKVKRFFFRDLRGGREEELRRVGGAKF